MNKIKDPKRYLTREIKFIEKDEKLLDRCCKELDKLENAHILPIIKYMYIYKNKVQNINYSLRGTINNLLVLYKLGITNVDPIKYNLPYELYKEDWNIDFAIIDKDVDTFVNTINNMQDDFKICKAVLGEVSIYDYSDQRYIYKTNSELLNNNLKYNEKGLPLIFLNNDDYYKEIYINIYSAHYNNSLYEYEKRYIKKYKPKTDIEFINLFSAMVNDDFTITNQDILFDKKQIELKDMICSREDVYNYLIKHKLDINAALKITEFIRMGKASKHVDEDKWNEYKAIMKNNECEDWFIEVLSKERYMWAKGDAASKYLYRFGSVKE